MKDGVDEERCRRIARRLRIPSRLAAVEVSEMRDLGGKGYAKSLKRLEELSDDLLEGSFLEDPVHLLIGGNFGTGKTMSSACLLRRAYLGIKSRGIHFFDAERVPLFARASEIGEYRFNRVVDDDNSEDYEQIRGRLFNCAFLVIDDIGRIADYKGERDFLERVIEHRYDEELSTVLTCNLSDEELKSQSPRFYDFLGRFEEILMIGETRRERNRG